jgi:hypothetical protein
MKTAKFSVALFLVLSAFASFATAVEPKASVQPLDSRHGNLFVFKVKRAFKGATVEIYYSNGDLVASKTMSKRRMIINFCDVVSGNYTIRVKKDNKVEEFKYYRK